MLLLALTGELMGQNGLAIPRFARDEDSSTVAGQSRSQASV
jgi:hypothetical protein